MTENFATDIGQSVKLSRKRLRMTQHEFAAAVGVHRNSISRLERGINELSDERLTKIINHIAEMERQETLEGFFDYLRITFPMHNLEILFNKILRIQKDFFKEVSSKKYGYIGVYQLDYIQVAFSKKKDNRGLVIELSGKGCRQFEMFLHAQKRTWFEFFSDCLEYNCNFTRVDIAIDDYKEYLSIPTLLNKIILRQELISKFNVFNFYISGRISAEEPGGTTIYLGSFKSDFYIIMYQKNYEQAKKLGIPIEDVPIKNRYELRFKNKRAKSVIRAYLQTGSLAEIVLGIMNDYLLFVDARDGVSRKYWKPNRRWLNFISDVEKMRLSVKIDEKVYESTKNWFQRTVAANVKMLEEIDMLKGENSVREMIDEAEMSNKHLHVIEMRAKEIF